MQAERRIAWARVAVVAAGIVVTSILHYVTPQSRFLWHIVFQRLYLLPIVYAALHFGWRGGVAAAAVSGILYVPHIVTAWHHEPEYTASQYAEIIVLFLVGVVTGILADRERRRGRELEATSDQLRRVNRELQDSFEQLRRADRLSAIGQLSASLAHEIRNPLGSIEGAANILDRPETTGEMRREFMGIIRKESQRLNRLLTNLLDFARPRPPEFQAVDLGRLIDSVVDLVGHTASHAGVRIRKEIAAGLPAVESDPEQLKQVILNLAINAIQAMPRGGELAVSAAGQDGSVVVRIRDEGEGIAAADLERIFDPFYTTKANGTGLGLSVALQIVEQHGGAIRAERNDGAGMTFAVELPARRKQVRK